MNPAGRSARREYELRRAADRERRRANAGWKLAVVTVTGLATFVVVRLVAPFDSGAESFLAGALALAVVVASANNLWGPRASTEAWRKGAEGEELTALGLAKLPHG